VDIRSGDPASSSTPSWGAGTVAIAAETYGRNWVGIELNPAFAELAEKRLAEWREKATQR
jgi:site-specific DNA-methyltransferase (adenine-specific)